MYNDESKQSQQSQQPQQPQQPDFAIPIPTREPLLLRSDVIRNNQEAYAAMFFNRAVSELDYLDVPAGKTCLINVWYTLENVSPSCMTPREDFLTAISEYMRKEAFSDPANEAFTHPDRKIISIYTCCGSNSGRNGIIIGFGAILPASTSQS